MNIIEALKLENEYLRVDNGDKWLVWDNCEWKVMQKKYGQKKTRMVCATSKESIAVSELIKND